jgi:multiple sugar transport system substrate-binding protein
LSGCGSPLLAGATGAGPDRDELTFWSLLGGGDGALMAGMLEAYRKSHPENDFTPVTLAWGDPYCTKLSLATLGDRPPDVAVAHLTRAQTLVRAGLLDPIAPADLTRHGMALDNFNPATVKSATVDGKLYAVPLDTHVYVL